MMSRLEAPHGVLSRFFRALIFAAEERVSEIARTGTSNGEADGETDDIGRPIGDIGPLCIK